MDLGSNRFKNDSKNKLPLCPRARFSMLPAPYSLTSEISQNATAAYPVINLIIQLEWL